MFNKQLAPPISTSICQDVNRYIIIPKVMYIISAVVFNLYSFGLAKLISRGLLDYCHLTSNKLSVRRSKGVAYECCAYGYEGIRIVTKVNVVQWVKHYLKAQYPEK